MPNVNLAGYKIKRLDVVNNIEKSGPIHIMNTFDFKCMYTSDGKFVIAVLTENIEQANGYDQFHISIDVEGTFSVENMDGIEDKKQVHVQCYDALFPYASQIVSQLGTNTGMSNMLLKKISMDTEHVMFAGKDSSAAEGEVGEMIQFPEK